MSKLIIAFLVIVNVVNASNLINAKDMRHVTKINTEKIKMRLINSEKGKKVFINMIEYLNMEMSKIASSGYYDTLSITFMNQPEKIKNLLKLLNKREEGIMKELIINELIKNGYKVTKNEHWNNKNSFYLTISW